MKAEWDEQLFRDAMDALAVACGWLPYVWPDSQNVHRELPPPTMPKNTTESYGG